MWVVVHRRGNGDDVEAAPRALCLVRGEVHGAALHRLAADLVRGVNAAAVERDLLFVEVIADHTDLFGKGHGDRHGRLAQAVTGQGGLAGKKLFIHVHVSASPII